jgi:hypothetical protein
VRRGASVRRGVRDWVMGGEGDGRGRGGEGALHFDGKGDTPPTVAHEKKRPVSRTERSRATHGSPRHCHAPEQVHEVAAPKARRQGGPHHDVVPQVAGHAVQAKAPPLKGQLGHQRT